MKAIGFTRYLPVENPESVVEVNLPDPTPTGRDILVRVKAVSVNPVDTKVRHRTEGVLDEPRVPGWDAAGVVEAVGDGVTFFAPGDEVYYAGDIGRPGCDATLHLVDERIVGRKPATLSFEEAAALPLTTITAWEALFDRLQVDQPGPGSGAGKRSILIIGGAGGVGSIAIQVAKKVADLEVIATASREETAAWCRGMGADAIVDHHKSLAAEFERIGVAEVDYILCLNATERHWENMEKAIRPQGRICLIVETEGGVPLDINIFQGKSVAIMWELMYTRPLFATPDMAAQRDLLNEVSRLVDAGTLRTTMTESLGPLNPENLRRAHGMVEAGSMIGKVVLSGIMD